MLLALDENITINVYLKHRESLRGSELSCDLSVTNKPGEKVSKFSAVFKKSAKCSEIFIMVVFSVMVSSVTFQN